MTFNRYLLVISTFAAASLAWSLAPGYSTAAPRDGASRPVARPVSDPPLQHAPQGHDFIAQGALLYRIAACGDAAPRDPRFDARVIANHCRLMNQHFDKYRKRWAVPASQFIAGLKPAALPDRVVYPFGGGDLMSALVVFPDAAEITTISLEAAGDPRAMDALAGAALKKDLEVIGHKVRRLLGAAHSTTKSLQIASHSQMPGTIVFAMAALSVHGYEPLSLRFFRIEANGSLKYLSESELDAELAQVMARAKGRNKRFDPRKGWLEQEAVFANMEIRYRRRGDTSGAERVYRHIKANLDDEHLTGEDRSVLVHLQQKGKVALMTKAASFLLWRDDFSIIRNYILAHAAWMLSDSSGIPPAIATAAGFEQIPYGDFAGPYFYKDPNQVHRQMVTLWATSPKRPLPFRFGYPDANKKNHMLVMRPKAEPAR